MSKRKKKFRAEIYQKLLNETAVEVKPEGKNETVKIVSEIQSAPANDTTVSVVKNASPIIAEVKKIMLVMSFLAMILIIFYILELKTPVLDNFGDLLLKFFRVS